MLQTKELPILQAKEGEEYGNNVIFNSKDFQTKLHMYGVYDLFDNKLAIKQDKEKYIFAVNGENKFAVNGKVDFVTFINDFYKDVAKREKRTAEKKAVIEVSELEKRTKVEIIMTETQQDLADLADQIKKNETLSERSTNIENMKYKVERLITFFEQEKKLVQDETSGWIFNTKYDRKDKGLRKMHKTEIDRRLKELNKIKEQIERLKSNKGKKYNIERDGKEIKDVKMDDVNGFDMKITLKQLGERVQELGKEAPDFILTRNDLILEKGDTTPYYEYIVNNVKDATKLKLALDKINNDYILLNKMSLSVAKRQALQQDLKDLSEYLNAYINNPEGFDPAKNPFIPKSGEAFAEFCKLDPELKKFAKLNEKAGAPSNGVAKPTYPGTTAPGNGTSETGAGTGNGTENTKNPKEYTSSTYSDAKEAFEKGGINGVSKYWLDQSNMRPEQKQFWGGVGNLAVTGGMIFIGWKMLSSAFKLVFKKEGYKDSKNRARLLGPTALIFGSQARTGEGPTKLFTGGALTEKIAGIFGRGSGENQKEGKTVVENQNTPQDKETGIKYREGFPGATAVFNGLTYGEMKQFLIQEKGQTKINPDQYQTLLNMFKTGAKKNEAGAAFLESIGKDDERHVIDLGLTGIGISRKDIQDDDNKDKKFNETASESIARLRSVTEFMDEKGYNKINSETQHFIDDYIAYGKNISELETLAKRGDVFYRNIEIQDQTGLALKVKELAKDDVQKEEELLLALNTFYENMPNANRKIEITGTRPTIMFKTYDQSSTINLKNKELIGFTPSRFSSYYETFKATNLTNRIKFLCKDKIAKSDKPFYLSTGKDITFDDAKLFSTDFDTEIMTAGWGGSLTEVSPTLEANKQAYCDYLNTLKFRKKAPTA